MMCPKCHGTRKITVPVTSVAPFAGRAPSTVVPPSTFTTKVVRCPCTSTREHIARAMWSAESYPDFDALPDDGTHFSKATFFGLTDAALDAAMPEIETMDGAVMNAMCEAFGWPEEFGHFPVTGGLSAACARAVAAYLKAIKERK